MSSVYNSTRNNNGVFSLLASNNHIFDNQKWEDIQAYTSVTVTISCGTAGNVQLRWANADDDSIPGTADINNPLATNSFYYNPNSGPVTKQFDTRARWLNLKYDGSLVGTTDASLVVATSYKRAPTEIKLTDDSTNIVSVNLGDTLNSLYVGLSDMSGTLINTTLHGQTGEALYTTLADGSGEALATTNNYRDITRVDQSVFFFDNSTNSSNPTIIVETNEFRVPNSQLAFRHGDVVNFVVDNSSDTRSGSAIFADSSFNGAGYLRSGARVHFTDHDSNFTRFQLLVDRDIGQWFTNDISVDYSSASNHATMAGTSAKFITSVGSDVRLVTVCGASVATVDDYYEIISDVSGFNQPNGISLSAGQIPLDLRFYQGSFHGSRRRSHMYITNQNNEKESLAVALRDASGHSFASTGPGSDSYHFRHDACNPTYPRVLVVLDDYDWPNRNGTVTQPALLTGIYNDMFTGDASYQQLLSNKTNYGVSLNQASTTKPAYAFTTARHLIDNNSDFIFSPVEPVDAAPPTFANGSPTTLDDDSTPLRLWQAAHLTIPLIDSCAFTDVVFVLGRSKQFTATDTYKDQIDQCASVWNNVNRYVIAPGVSSELTGTNSFASVVGDTPMLPFAGESADLLHLTGGQQDNILYYYAGETSTSSQQTRSNIYNLYSTLIDRIHLVKHTGHNALAVAPTDICGHAQAATGTITDARFGHTAHYYALADQSGFIVDTTQTAAGRSLDSSQNNAMFVHLNLRDTANSSCAKSISHANPLPIQLQGANLVGRTFDMVVSGALVTTTDISNRTLNLDSLGFVNESPAPVWVKLYDVSQGVAATATDPVINLGSNLLFNIAVPGLGSRDLTFTHPVSVTNGLHLIASTNFSYDSSLYAPGTKHIFVHGTYKHTS